MSGHTSQPEPKVPAKGFALGTPSAELGEPEEGGLGGPTGPEISDEKGDIIESEDGKPITGGVPPRKDADKS
jgi:hypothetical protein